MLFNWLRSLTDLIVSCCKDIVGKSEDQNNNHIGDEDETINDLMKIEVSIIR